MTLKLDENTEQWTFNARGAMLFETNRDHPFYDEFDFDEREEIKRDYRLLDTNPRELVSILANDHRKESWAKVDFKTARLISICDRYLTQRMGLAMGDSATPLLITGGCFPTCFYELAENFLEKHKDTIEANIKRYGKSENRALYQRDLLRGVEDNVQLIKAWEYLRSMREEKSMNAGLTELKSFRII